MDTMTYASLAAIPGSLAKKNKQPVPPEIELTPLDVSYLILNSVGHLPQTNFRVVRMVHWFGATSPVLYLLSAMVFSFCLLLVAFSL
jgi:hypothetical protein